MSFGRAGCKIEMRFVRIETCFVRVGCTSDVLRREVGMCFAKTMCFMRAGCGNDVIRMVEM